jgi:hypothetical protein
VGEKINANRVSVGKAERKRLVVRPGYRWEDNIKFDLGEIEWSAVDWIHRARDRDQWRALVNTVMNLQLP